MQPTSAAAVAAAAAVGAVIGAVVVWTSIKSEEQKGVGGFICHEATPDPTTVDGWLTLATTRMKIVVPPKQSHFRVYAILTWRDTQSGVTGYVSGTNSETPFIGGSLCAERAAAVQLRELPSTIVVTAIYLTSDLMDAPITPGVLCREYLLSCVAPDVPVWLTTADMSVKRVTSLNELYPFPSIYVGQMRNALKDCGKACSQRSNESWPSNQAFTASWVRLISVAMQASRQDILGGAMHPIHYGAALEFSDGSVISSCQKAGMEYGTTIDAVTSLLRDIDTKKSVDEGTTPVRLVQVDQYGNLHAPFAPARAQLYERGKEKMKVGVQSSTGVRSEVTVESLVPDCPTMCEIWG
jgi:cytidine deaminase